MTLPESGDPPLLLHNPRCSKSRAVRQLLEARGIGFVERRYLEEPLDRDELAELGRRLGLPPAEWIRDTEAAFADEGLDPASDEKVLLDAIATHPILLERPILVCGGRARVGRPPERVLELLESAP